MIRIEGVEAADVHTFKDEHGFRTLKLEGLVAPLLSTAFEHDIQTVATTEAICDRLDCVANGWDETRSFTGNSSTVTMYPDRVTIENDILDDEEPFEMSVEQYRVILDEWATFLDRLGQTGRPRRPAS